MICSIQICAAALNEIERTPLITYGIPMTWFVRLGDWLAGWGASDLPTVDLPTACTVGCSDPDGLRDAAGIDPAAEELRR
mmetsp:Transcript_31621/g.74206  ORF Transcript_31621/g.74206 Transcript_31621/m.74206 type:complete len:80 (-) Transcript_31621:656-895(-)